MAIEGPLERIFTFKGDRSPQSAYDPTDPESYEQFIQALISDAKDYEDSILAPKRDEAQRYYYGMLPDLGRNDDAAVRVEDPNATYDEISGTVDKPSKSTYVSTDVRDAVLMMLPSLVRIFAASENVIALVPRTPQDEAMAEQATNYVNYCFWQDNQGFLLLYGAFKDALTLKTGFAKWWTDNNRATKRKKFVNITTEQAQLILSEDQTAKIVPGSIVQNPMTGGLDLEVEYIENKPLTRVEAVPPEEMRLDRYARTLAKSRITGHERIVGLDELVAMGYDREFAKDYVQSGDYNQFSMEALIRNPGRAMSSYVGDGVLYGEYYVRVNDQLRYVCTMGESRKIVKDEPANRIKFALFSCDPISHTIVGDSIADLCKDTQRIKTNMVRGVLDSLAESINPRTVVNELTTNLDDALNDDLGAVIRTRGDPQNAVQFAVTPFAGQAALPVLEYLDSALQRRTGLSDAARGLDPKQLQSSTQIGVEAVINGQQERTELVARVLAETGFRDLFHGLFMEIVENENVSRTLRINGNWVAYNTGTFDPDMSVEVNPTLGKGSDTVRMMTLAQIKQDQMMVFQTFGPSNPVVGIPELMNTQTDMLNIANIKNVTRYFKQVDPQVLQQMQQAPKEPDAMTIAAQANQERVKMQTAKSIGDAQFNAQKQAMDDAFRRDKLNQQKVYEDNKIRVQQEQMALDHQVDIRQVAADMAKTTAQEETKRHKVAAEVETANADRAHQAQQAEADRAHEAQQAEADRQAQASLPDEPPAQ